MWPCMIMDGWPELAASGLRHEEAGKGLWTRNLLLVPLIHGENDPCLSLQLQAIA